MTRFGRLKPGWYLLAALVLYALLAGLALSRSQPNLAELRAALASRVAAVPEAPPPAAPADLWFPITGAALPQDATVIRLANLAGVAPGLALDERLYCGQVVGYVGNSGTDDGVAGSNRGAPLHFELWRPGGGFFGQGGDEAAVQAAAQALFVGL